MRDDEQTNKQTLKIELLSQWKLEAEFRNCRYLDIPDKNYRKWKFLYSLWCVSLYIKDLDSCHSEICLVMDDTVLLLMFHQLMVEGGAG